MRWFLTFLLVVSISKNRCFAQSVIIDSLQQIINVGEEDSKTARAMNHLANEYARTDHAIAKSILYRSIALGISLKDFRTLSASYSNLVTIHQNTGNPDSSVYYLTLLRRLSDNAGGRDLSIIKGNYYATAGLFYKKTGHPKSAIPYFRNAVELWEKDNDKVAAAGQLLNMGNTHHDMGDYSNALKSHLKALKYFEGAGNKRGESFCYQSISSSFLAMKQFDNALKYSKKAIVLKTELKDKRGLGTAKDGLGQIYNGLNNYDQAIKNYDEALRIAKDLNLLTEQIKTYFHIGKTYAAKKDAQQALVNFNQSKKLADELGDSSTSSAVDIELISLQKDMTLRDRETKIFSSLKTFEQNGDRVKEAATYQNLAGFYTAKGEYDKALDYTNRYYKLTDSIQNIELQLQLTKMEEQYTIEKNEKEITILKKDRQLNIVKLEKQEAFQVGAVLFLALLVATGLITINRYRVVQQAKRQVEIERMRNNIARDLHDDIGSTITSINVLSNVLLKQKSDEKTIYSNLQKIKENSSVIMESMSDIVWAINPNNDTIEKIIYRMMEFAAEILEPLNISFHFEKKGDMDKVKLDPKKRKDFFLIFKESVNNAAKYSHCSHIDIVILFEGKNLQMTISDNGKGFDEAMVKKGNGLNNIRERAREMSATLHYTSRVGEGTSVKLDMPLS